MSERVATERRFLGFDGFEWATMLSGVALIGLFILLF
jgi:hypothetical protein